MIGNGQRVELNVKYSPWKKELDRGQYKKAVVAMVERYDWVTFTEIMDMLRPYMAVDGDEALYVGPAANNVLMYALMSSKFADLIEKLLDTRKLHPWTASPMCYMIDGGSLRVPLARSVRAYKTLRWLPVCFRTTAIDTKTSTRKKQRRGAAH